MADGIGFNPNLPATIVQRRRGVVPNPGGPEGDTLGTNPMGLQPGQSPPQDQVQVSSEILQSEESRRYAGIVSNNAAFYDTLDNSKADNKFSMDNVTKVGEALKLPENANREQLQERVIEKLKQAYPELADEKNADAVKKRAEEILGAQDYYGKDGKKNELTALETAFAPGADGDPSKGDTPGDGVMSTADADKVHGILDGQNQIDEKVNALKSAYETKPEEFQSGMENSINESMDASGRLLEQREKLGLQGAESEALNQSQRQAVAQVAGIDPKDEKAMEQWIDDNAILAHQAMATGALNWMNSQNGDQSRFNDFRTSATDVVNKSNDVLSGVAAVPEDARNQVFGVANELAGGTAYTPDVSKVDSFGEGDNSTVWGILQGLGLTDQQIAGGDLVNKFGLADPNKVNGGQELKFSPELRRILEQLIPQNENRPMPSLLPPGVAA